MRQITRVLLLAWPLACVVLLGAASPPPAGGHAPHVTRILVKKSARTMKLFDGDAVVASYAVAVGGGGAGPKKKEGDMITPTGRYKVLRHLPSHLRIFLQLDYPNAADRARFDELKKKGDLPKNATIGGDIGIHGEPPEAKPFKKADYKSHGCVVLEDAEIDQVARMVADGTAVDIED
jgi:murein L,D-transpeptidase YafK